MRKLQQSKIVFENGKQKTKDKVGGVKKVVDSAADHLSFEGKNAIAAAKKTKGIEIITIWEDLGAIERPKKEEEKEETKK